MAVSRLFLTMIGRSEGNVQVYMSRTISQHLSPFLFSSTTNIQLFSFKKTPKNQKNFNIILGIFIANITIQHHQRYHYQFLVSHLTPSSSRPQPIVTLPYTNTFLDRTTCLTPAPPPPCPSPYSPRTALLLPQPIIPMIRTQFRLRPPTPTPCPPPTTNTAAILLQPRRAGSPEDRRAGRSAGGGS